MKISQLKNIVKEAVKEAIQEEIKDILLEAVKGNKQPIQETNNNNQTTKLKPEDKVKLRENIFNLLILMMSHSRIKLVHKLKFLKRTKIC